MADLFCVFSLCMARKPRYVPEGGALVEVTCRTFQGRFLLRPRQDLNDIVVGVLAHFLENYPGIGLVGIVVLSTHLHLLLSVESQEDLSNLMRDFGSKTAREVNKLYGWGGALFSPRYRSICVTHEPAAQIARLSYLLAQSVKEHLVARVKDWPGIHFGKTLLEGRSFLSGKWIDRTKKTRLEIQARQKAKGKNKRKEVGREDYTSAVTVPLEQLPCWRDLEPGKYLERIRKMIRRIEKDAEAERERQGAEVVGVEAICQRNPQSRQNELQSSPAPLVHAASKRERLAWREAFAWFVLQYREASERLRNGDRDAPFPEGSFPPRLPFVGSAGGVPLESAVT